MDLGILFALGALIGWSFGDFSIQKTVRAVGNVRALFYIGTFGGVLLIPLIYKEIIPTFGDSTKLPLLVFACLLVMVTALANFEGLKLGKLSVVLPINGVELIFAILLAVVLNNERYTPAVFTIIAVVIFSLFLTTISSMAGLKSFRWEKGVAWALAGAVGLGISNYTIGIASRAFSPLFTIWLTHTAVAIGTGIIMLKRNDFQNIAVDLRKHPKIIFAQSIFDNLAWIFFAYATVLIPIGIASTISEGYLALGTLLGVALNKEKLKTHQYVGATVVIVGVLALSWLTA